ncbi:helix-turn-helix domain-containing protein [Streptomyces sp. NPDC098789]|uniref:helix-turn-helix domain-containing protein n=1 Tax=Streptomyces sp. NPDC098789 TaxID=3366098 RepID=UPI00382DAB4B
MKTEDVGAAFGAQVKSARELHGWSQAELAARLGAAMEKEVNPLVITRIEGSKRPVSITELVALASIFNMTPGALLEGMAVDVNELDHIEAQRAVRRWIVREAAARRSLGDVAVYLRRHPHTRETIRATLHRTVGEEVDEIMTRLDEAEIEGEEQDGQHQEEA